MMREPWFWRERTLAARVVSASLAPGALVYDGVQRARLALTRPAPAPVPVFCVGNATLGGVGKTPFALMLAARLAAIGTAPHFLTRGYGGALAGPVRVDRTRHDSTAVGDEALLLANEAPTWVSRDRPAGARAAAEAGAGAIVMDDGFQNPTLEKTFSLLLIDAADPAGNGALFPAGPLRESMRRARGRADAVVSIFPDEASAIGTPKDPDNEAAFHAWLAPSKTPPTRVVAFCGIGSPRRFFCMLEARGFDVAGRYAFPDHHRYKPEEMGRLRREAARADATLITTAKDAARLSSEMKDGVEILPVFMRTDDPERLDRLINETLARFYEKAERPR
ncbi:MAG: tetraacyldisaccharide 4'-kinase [Amphiplicatus sp.]